MATKLPRSFYARPTLTVARDLLGKHLVHQTPAGRIIGEINEVEAYLGQEDPASHAYRGMTTRAAVMFGEAGFSYVYFIYGSHYCINVVAETEGTAGAVLLRSVIPMEGVTLMKENRGIDRVANLTNGPGKLCQAFGITRAHNGIDFVTSTILFLEDVGKVITRFEQTPRIGITKATDKPWRFVY